MADSEHWVSVLARKIIESKKPPFLVASGITTSGPVHIGTASEFLYPNAVVSYLSKEHETSFIFIGDIMDAFKSVPGPLQKFEGELTPHLGKPLVYVPDPFKCHDSYGDHFLMQAKDLMDTLGIHPEIIRNNELYDQGKYDEYAVLYLKKKDQIRDIVFDSSRREKKGKEYEEWNPIMPICKKCGKITTTRVTEYTEDSYSYICDRKLKYTQSCGNSGNNKITDHKYKFIWRVEWPTRQTFLNVSVEGAGKDHLTRGGSVDTARMIHRDLLGHDGPFFFKFGFFTFHGKKYSKSKGIGVDVNTLVKLAPAEVLKYFVYKSDSQSDKDFDPTGRTLIKLYDEFERISELKQTKEEMSRADLKKSVAYTLSGSRKWKCKFLDALLYYQIYKDWDMVGGLLQDKEGVKFLAPFIEFWVKEGYPPEEYSFVIKPTKPPNPALVKAFAAKLTDDLGPVDIHNLIFTVATELEVKPADMFKELYISIIGKEKGPKMGKLIKAAGVQKIKDILSNL